MTNLLKRLGFTNLYVVKEQELPDPTFNTVKAPNPEDKEVFNLAIELAEKHNGDIIMGTDPDADRLGVLVKTENTLTGFKYIREKIKEYKESGGNTFIFGYEESYGYLAGDFVRDKDAFK